MIVTCRILYGITGTSNNTAIKTVVTTVGSRFGVLSACLHNAPNEVPRERECHKGQMDLDYQMYLHR